MSCQFPLDALGIQFLLLLELPSLLRWLLLLLLLLFERLLLSLLLRLLIVVRALNAFDRSCEAEIADFDSAILIE